MNHTDATYLEGIETILEKGVIKKDRTGVGTISYFGLTSRYDLKNSFPLLTSKKIYTRGVFGELLWFLQGRTDNQWLSERRIHIWDEWAGEDGDLGPIYAYQWRHFGADYISQKERDISGVNPGGVDQILKLLQDLRDNPFSRRHIVSAWNPAAIEEMALPPCHSFMQFYVTPDDEGKPYGLSCMLTQRSGDWGLGVPFNIASYAAMTKLFADLSGLTPLEFVHTVGDAHIYLNHVDKLQEQLERVEIADSPKLTIHHPSDPRRTDITDPKLFERYSIEDFIVSDYNPLPPIKMEVAV